MTKKITVPDIPPVEQRKPGFQPPEAPKVAKVDLFAAPEKAATKQNAIDYLSQLAGVKPDTEQEAGAERNIKRKERIANLTGAFKLLASAHYANKGYHVPRATPDRYLAKTQAELLRQKSMYDKNLAAYNARRAAIGSRMLSMQQAANIETNREGQADKRAAERTTQLEKNRESLDTYRKGQLTNAGNRTTAYNRHNKAMEGIRERKFSTTKSGGLSFDYGNQPVSIPKNKLVGIAVNIQQQRKALGLPLSENLQDIYGDLSIPANLNKISWYIAQNYQYYTPPGQKAIQPIWGKPAAKSHQTLFK